MVKTEVHDETRIVKKFTYVTDDGQVFNNYNDARRHDIESTMKRKIKGTDAIDFNVTNINHCIGIYKISSGCKMEF